MPSSLLPIDGFDVPAATQQAVQEHVVFTCSVCGDTGVVYVGELEDLRYKCKSCAPEPSQNIGSRFIDDNEPRICIVCTAAATVPAGDPRGTEYRCPPCTDADLWPILRNEPRILEQSFQELADKMRAIIFDKQQGGRSDLAQLVELKRWKDWLGTTLTFVNGDIDRLEESLLEDFAAEGVSSKKTAEGALVYISKRVWASAVNQEALNRALVASGNGWLVKRSVNSQSLSSWVKERGGEEAKTVEEINAKLPEGVAPLLNVTLKRTLGVRGK